MKLIDILNNLSTQPTEDYGSVILFSDIFLACKYHGQDNQHIISALLEDLEKSKIITIVYNKTLGFDDLIIGIKMNG